MGTKYSTASQLLQTLKDDGFPIIAPIDIEAIAAKLKIKVVYDESLDDSGIVGKIEFDKNQEPLISINPTENFYEPRKRFTLAHEIAHYCLHSSPLKSFLDTKKSMNRDDSYWDEHESAANSFAAQLLMPKSLIIEKGNEIASAWLAETKEKIKRNDFISKMSKLFKVSEQAIEYRLKNIGILS